MLRLCFATAGITSLRARKSAQNSRVQRSDKPPAFALSASEKLGSMAIHITCCALQKHTRPRADGRRRACSTRACTQNLIALQAQTSRIPWSQTHTLIALSRAPNRARATGAPRRQPGRTCAPSFHPWGWLLPEKHATRLRLQVQTETHKKVHSSKHAFSRQECPVTAKTRARKIAVFLSRARALPRPTLPSGGDATTTTTQLRAAIDDRSAPQLQEARVGACGCAAQVCAARRARCVHARPRRA